jgi:hypothetical protein
VAILCNHQKGVSKNHDATMAKLLEKKEAMKAELKDASGAAAGRIKCGACACLVCLARSTDAQAASGSAWRLWTATWSPASRSRTCRSAPARSTTWTPGAWRRTAGLRRAVR